MRAAQGILTARGGMTSHAALVARGWGKCCIVGAGDASRSTWPPRRMTVGGETLQGRRLDHAERHAGPRLRQGAAGDDGRHGEPALPGVHEDRRQVPHAGRAHQCRHAGRRPRSPAASAPRASACSAPSTCSTARARDEPLFLLRKMILSNTAEERSKAARRAVPVRQDATSRPRWRRWTACR